MIVRREPGRTTINGGGAGAARRLLRVGAQFAKTLDERMADIESRAGRRAVRWAAGSNGSSASRQST